VCPKEIRISNIARMNRDYLKAQFAARWRDQNETKEAIRAQALTASLSYGPW